MGPHHRHESSLGRTDSGEFRTAALAAYPPRLCRAITHYFLRAFRDMCNAGGGPGGSRRAGFRRPRTTGYSRCAPGGAECLILNETVEVGRVPVLRRDGLAAYVHVDDIGVMGEGPRPLIR